MARLLFSSLNNRSNTLDCFITNCAHGDPFLPLPPPPPDPNPDPDPDSSSSIPIDVQHSNRLLPNFLIAAASFLALSFLLLLLFYFLLRLRRRRRRLLRSLAPHPPPPPPPPPPPQNPDLDDDDVPHHVWFIRTVGLDESIVKAIPTMVYKSLGNNGDCSVCLGEFRDGEIVKLLPKCAHAFHVDCIDTWLRSHVNCPLCRAAVVVDLVGVSESTRIEIGEEDQESCLDTVGLSNLTAGSSSSSSSSLSREEVENGHENENDMQPIRRSVSMDTLALGMIMLRAELDSAEGKLGNGKREIELKGVGICKSKEVKGDDDNLGKLGSDLKRSMSSRSGRFFFPRYGRGWNASVLPL